MNKENPREGTISDSGEEWRVKMRTKERRKERKMINNEERKAPINEGRREINRKMRGRPEAILVKIGEGKGWL
jgi:hypothetical protein